MSNWIDDRLKEYYAWMRDNTLVKEDSLTGWVTISTPFVGLFNDNIQIYARRENNEIILSDDGETLDNLALAGVEISRSQQRKQNVDYILSNYGVELSDGELMIRANNGNFPRQKHNLISAISEISDMSIVAKHTVAAMFNEDVAAYLEEMDITYSRSFIARGSTGLEITFDFQIAGKTQEAIIKPFNTITRSMVERFIFGWNDIKPVRENQSHKVVKGIAIINDINSDPKDELLHAIRSQDADVILWSQRHNSEARALLSIN